MEVTNISAYVLDIAPAAGTGAYLRVFPHEAPSDPLPTLAGRAGQLEVEAQNAAMARVPLPNPWALVPVGATLTATTNRPPVRLIVGEDAQRTVMSFSVAAWVSFVVGNAIGENPNDYYQAIADCVDDSYQLLQDFQQPPPVAVLLTQSLKVIASCGELEKKVEDYLNQRRQRANLNAELANATQSIDEPDWVSKYSEAEQVRVTDEIRPIL